MSITNDIYPVSDFNRKPAEHIKRLQETKKPEILTVNGKAAVVLVDPESYDQLTRNAELIRTLEQLPRANAEYKNGKSQPLHEAFTELKEELKDKAVFFKKIYFCYSANCRIFSRVKHDRTGHNHL